MQQENLFLPKSQASFVDEYGVQIKNGIDASPQPNGSTENASVSVVGASLHYDKQLFNIPVNGSDLKLECSIRSNQGSSAIRPSGRSYSGWNINFGDMRLIYLGVFGVFYRSPYID